MEITFNKMCSEHLDRVIEIERASYVSPWSRQAFFSEIQNKFADYIVAVFDGMIVGYGGMWLILDEAQITNIAVHPLFRSKNIGKMIMMEMIKRAVLMGINRITLEVRPSNLVARHLYQAMGFIEKGVRKKYYTDNNEDAIIMWKYNLADREEIEESDQSKKD